MSASSDLAAHLREEIASLDEHRIRLTAAIEALDALGDHHAIWIQMTTPPPQPPRLIGKTVAESADILAADEPQQAKPPKPKKAGTSPNHVARQPKTCPAPGCDRTMPAGPLALHVRSAHPELAPSADAPIPITRSSFDPERARIAAAGAI